MRDDDLHLAYRLLKGLTLSLHKNFKSSLKFYPNTATTPLAWRGLHSLKGLTGLAA